MSAGVTVGVSPRKETAGAATALRRLVSATAAAFGRERALSLAGLLGVALGSGVLAVLAARGRYVLPEGDLYKAGTFDIAIGLYVLTLALLLPLAGFGRRGLAGWRWCMVGLALYVYAVETVQVARGLDPRFTRAGSPADQILGITLGLAALGIIAVFVVLAWRFFFRRGAWADSPGGALVLTGVRYGAAATFVGFAAGFWLSANQGSAVGETGNLLPLHAAGFHGLQAVPLVALLSAWAGAAGTAARRRVHAAGLCWLGLCAALWWQTAAGRSVLEPSAATAAAAACALAWLATTAAAALAWARAGFRVQGPRADAADPPAQVSLDQPARISPD
ncbi:MAG TPA: hypothetical protein VEY09_10125 [Pyrinomonadaceae bacterium]|nr:hypothetical protein [Pyrinomonadaceae bacterium]